MPKLYEIPINVKIRVIEHPKVPIASPHVDLGETLDFKHVDGMYSLCYNSKGEAVHLAAWTQVEVIDENPN